MPKPTDMTRIAIAGSVLVDKIKEIHSYPTCGQLAQIGSLHKAVGGCVPNVAIDLKRLDNSIDVLAVGKVGNDEDGKYVTEVLKDNGVDVSNVAVSSNATSFTDVMSIVGGQRTFFTYAGASSEFGFDDVDFAKLNVSHLHLGYFLLLDKVDNGDGLRILQKAKSLGITTSIDLVTENTERYALVRPCLPYVDNLIVNETEASKLAGIDFDGNNLQQICAKLKYLGVTERVIIHKTDTAVCMSDDGYTQVESCHLPQGFVQGTTGAGDAFCAGVLLGICQGLADKDILSQGCLSAVASLSKPDATSGMESIAKIKEKYGKYQK